MKKRLQTISGLIILWVISLLSVPSLVWADDIPAPYQWLPSITGTGVIGLRTPSGLDFIKSQVVPFLISGALFIAIILSLIFLMIGGIRWIMSAGEKQAVTEARGMVTYALVGLVLALLSFMILGALQYVLHADLGLPRWVGGPSPCTRGPCP